MYCVGILSFMIIVVGVLVVMMLVWEIEGR